VVAIVGDLTASATMTVETDLHLVNAHQREESKNHEITHLGISTLIAHAVSLGMDRCLLARLILTPSPRALQTSEVDLREVVDEVITPSEAAVVVEVT
jgi:hypothetical protein